MMPVSLRRLSEAIDERDADGGENEHTMDDRLPHHAGFGVLGIARSQTARLDERAQQVDRRNADDRHRELDLEHAGVDMAQPFGLIGVSFEIEARNKGLVAANDD